MPRAHITSNGVWVRRIHDTWENASGYRTDIPQSVLTNPAVTRIVFVLDDNRAIIVPIQDAKAALARAPRRSNGCVGPYYVDPHCGTLNGVSVHMDIRLLSVRSQAA